MKVTLVVQTRGPAHACLSCQMETWLGKGERMCESISQTCGAALGGKWGLGSLEHAHPGGGFCSCLSLHDDLQPWLCVPLSLPWITEVFGDGHWEIALCAELGATCWCVRRDIPALSRTLLALLLSPQTLSLDWRGKCHLLVQIGANLLRIAFWGAEVCGCRRARGALGHLLYLEVFLDGQKSPVSFHFIFFLLPDVLAEHAEFVWLEVCIFLTGKQKKWKI